MLHGSIEIGLRDLPPVDGWRVTEPDGTARCFIEGPQDELVELMRELRDRGMFGSASDRPTTPPPSRITFDVSTSPSDEFVQGLRKLICDRGTGGMSA